MKKTAFLLLLLSVAISCGAQIVEPIKWSSAIEMKNETEGTVILNATVDNGWHLYGLDLPEGGPYPTEITFEETGGIEFTDEVTPSRPPIEQVDMVFHLKLGWWDADVSFARNFKITEPGQHTLTANVNFQACSDNTCIPPKEESFTLQIGSSAPGETDNAEVVTVTMEKDEPVNMDDDGWWKPVKFSSETAPISQSPWWLIFIWGFGGGLLALLTPCVWPMIPMTVSFFLKKNSNKGKSVRDAAIYGVSIIIIYLILGLAITGFFGASKLNELSTNALFNIIFFLILVVFGISFLGAFEITLPSKWSNSTDSRAERTTGLISIFFMAFTLALVSFSCTGPIIGTLLVEAASMGNIAGPAIGMGGFALALALPFTLFAIFPTWLKEMPRSGGWLNSVKVVLGFLELALSLKFLSVADLAYGWGLLDREIFVALWIVIFALLGLYLLGKLQFSHDTPVEHVSVSRFFLALFSFSFAIYLLPGMWGAPLKGVSAFVPPLYTQDFNLYTGGQFEEFDDYDKGMRYALDNHRPVLIDFSGYGCVNCRKMEGAVFDTDIVHDRITENFVLIKLMVDDKTKLDSPYTVIENGKEVKIETVADKWSYLQRHKFGANIQPYYVMLDNKGNALAEPMSYDENVTRFVEWLDSGIGNYAKQSTL